MNKTEYMERRAMINENVLDALFHLVGDAMPHTVPALSQIMDKWQRSIDGLDAESMKDI